MFGCPPEVRLPESVPEVVAGDSGEVAALGEGGAEPGVSRVGGAGCRTRVSDFGTLVLSTR